MKENTIKKIIAYNENSLRDIDINHNILYNIMNGMLDVISYSKWLFVLIFHTEGE
ncbi:MAG: hypothetical protein IJO74_03545 [Clostridia bacterium]|nr:hypothetical protein [Clostridia bacterium]